MMLRDGDKVWLTASEKAFLSTIARERVDPQTVTDYNAWIEFSALDLSDAEPEQRLAKAVLLAMRIEA